MKVPTAMIIPRQPVPNSGFKGTTKRSLAKRSSAFPDDDAAAAADELFMKTIGSRRSAAFLASSAARSTTSMISWQCLHFFALAKMLSPQKGHSFFPPWPAPKKIGATNRAAQGGPAKTHRNSTGRRPLRGVAGTASD